jgi:hypothetical protein
MANAVKAFIERQGIKLPIEIEPVLIGANPGLHIESTRPAIRVVMIDGVKSFVSSLASSPPVLKAEAVHEFTERIVNPRSPKKATASPSVEPRAAWQEEKTQPPAGAEVSRARAIFNAAEESKPFNPADFDFAMVDEASPQEGLTAPADLVESSPAQPLSGPTPQRKRFLGMTPLQSIIVAALAAAVLCILAIFAYLIFFGPTPILP